MAAGLSIAEVAARTGLAPATVRMWEQRHGFPRPERTGSGYRRYCAEDVETLRRAQAYRRLGLSVAAAIERAREAGGASDHPSLYAAVAAGDPGVRPHVLRKSTLIALSRAIEHETLGHAAAPVLFAAFQREAFYRDVERRYGRLACHADAAAVFADFAAPGDPPGGPLEVPIAADDAMANEWAVVVDAPGYAACLVAWEQPDAGGRDGERRFEAIWTVDPAATRRAAEAAARMVARADAAHGRRLQQLLAGRPLAIDQPAPALTALANRAVAYLDGAAGA
jgi:DICT domain-containing protein/predicted DNA-binding transcriptional regulator AlpA